MGGSTRKLATMDEDDVPPQPQQTDTGFSGELGRTFAGVVWVALFLGIAGAALFLILRWTGHW
jgi:hypothetical protein